MPDDKETLSRLNHQVVEAKHDAAAGIPSAINNVVSGENGILEITQRIAQELEQKNTPATDIGPKIAEILEQARK
jgi:hypothetical protein